MSIKKESVGEALLSENIYATLRDLCLLGSRFSGTESEKQAQAYIKTFVEELGLTVKEWEFDYQGWRRGDCHFQLLHPVKKSIPSISLVLAPSTASEGISAQVVIGNGGSELELKGKTKAIDSNFLMVHSGKTEEGWLHRRIKYANAVKHGAQCFIFANHNPGQLFPTGSVVSNAIGPIPAIGISKENYDYIHTLLDLHETVEGTITVTNDTPRLTSKHLIWEIPGKKTDEVIVIGGHYDGHDLAQGATDNGGSIAIILELTRLLVKYDIQLERTIRFITFGVEEFGVVGSTIYVEKEDLADVKAMLNLDGLIGHLGKHITCNGNEDLLKLVQSIRTELFYDVKVSNTIVTASDNYPFLCEGIPALCIYGENPDPTVGRGWGHTSADTFDKISRLDMKVSLAFALTFVNLFVNQETLPMRCTKAEIKKILQNAQLEENLRKLKKWPFDKV